MREILFRGKRTNDGRWIEGYYMHHHNRMASPVCDGIKPEDEDHIILYDRFADWNMPRDIVYTHVDPETVGQYTGLQDKNGNRIFEGDIVRGMDALEKGLVVEGYIDHQYGSFCIVGDLMTHFRWMDYEVEVIGNIHDNPEMIGGKDDGQD